MNALSPDTVDIDKIIARILENRKYRDLNMPAETVKDLLRRELSRAKDLKTAEKNAREKLHQIIAPYLGDPDYAQAQRTLAAAQAGGVAALRVWCLEMLAAHTSSKERIPVMERFYRQIFDVTGLPNSIQDLACAMNPFAIPWMNLPETVVYRAYDLHSPRVALIQCFLRAWGLPPLAFVRDILLEPPQEQTEVTFFFKEAHRFEARRKGSCAEFFRRLQTNWIVVSLPSENLTGQHQMRDRQRRLIDDAVKGEDWTVIPLEIEKEMVFCIRKYGEEKNPNP